jgi:glutathione S-transferase
MSIVFYQGNQPSSASPVAFALAELGVPHEKVTLNLAAGEARNPAFLALNPNGKVPTLVVDGTPIFEALGIMMWLGDRFGIAKKMWPAESDPARLTAYAWSTWTYVTFGATLRRFLLATSSRVPPELHSAVYADHSGRELQELLGLLDVRLAGMPYMAGDAFTLLDVIVSGAVGFGAQSGVDLTAHAFIQAWLGRVTSRPAFRAAMA